MRSKLFTLAVLFGIAVVIVLCTMATTGAQDTSPLPSPTPWTVGCLRDCPAEYVQLVADYHEVPIERVFCCDGVFYHESGTIELGCRYEILPSAFISPLQLPTPTPIAVYLPIVIRSE